MIPLPDLENLVRTRMLSKQPVNRFFDKLGFSVLIGIRTTKGIPVSIRIDRDMETRYFDEIPTPRDLKEIVEFLSTRIVVKQIHES